MRQPIPRSRLITVLIHVIGWGFIFGFPFLIMSRNGFNISFTEYLNRDSIVPFSFLVVFYLNYYLLIPRYLFDGHTRKYLFLNTLLILCVAAGVHFWQEFSFRMLVSALPAGEKLRGGPPKWIFLVRNMFTMILTVGLSAAIRFSGRWTQIEASRQEAERAKAEAERSRAEAELTNLRSQLNPHFLLNTLNNIYALIAFDSNKAQEAVQELSRLLRHVLYDNQQGRVPLGKEMDFIRSYIELMRIRLAANVTVETHIDIPDDSRTLIAPLIFISLIENAFKHGISPTEPSYIRIRFSERDREVRCDIRNSYHPKNDTDKSGSGIGLTQVRKRLELTYPGNYVWNQGVDASGKEYRSDLIIRI